MREQFVYALLLTIKFFSRACYRFDISWIGDIPEDPWKNLCLVTFLNHTSLYDPFLSDGFPIIFSDALPGMG